MIKMEKRPKIGIGVMVLDEERVLMQKRKNSHGDGTWSFPGGHLEYHENFRDCARREVYEETGLEVDVIDDYPVAVTNDFFEEGKHYVTLYLRARPISGEPETREKDKLSEIDWFPWEKLPRPLFKPLENLIKQDYNPFKDLYKNQ